MNNCKKMIEDRCPICLDPLLENTNNCDKATYNLPECNHSYHTECITHWFRNGNSNCPCCGDCGTVPTSDDVESGWYESIMTKFKHVNQLSKKTKSSDLLKTQIETIKQISDKNVLLRVSLKELNNTNGVFKEIQKKRLKLDSKIQHNNRNIFQLKKEVVLSHPIKPLIIVTRKVIS